MNIMHPFLEMMATASWNGVRGVAALFGCPLSATALQLVNAATGGRVGLALLESANAFLMASRLVDDAHHDMIMRMMPPPPTTPAATRAADRQAPGAPRKRPHHPRPDSDSE